MKSVKLPWEANPKGPLSSPSQCEARFLTSFVSDLASYLKCFLLMKATYTLSEVEKKILSGNLGIWLKTFCEIFKGVDVCACLSTLS